MDIVDRLKIYMEHIGLQISQFADTANIPRPTLSQILSGRNKKISNEVLGKLHAAYPSLNISWLLFGDEPMETNGEHNPRVSSSSEEDRNPPVRISAPDEDQREETPVKESLKPNADIPHASSHAASISLMPDSSKRVQTIMVFYSDNSFETFTPAQR